MDWKKLVRAIAPTLGKAIGGPLGGMAAKVVTDALGVKDESAITQALKSATPEQLKAIRDADQAFATKMTELGIELERVNADDRANARHMQEITKSWVPGAIAIFLHLLLAALLVMLSLHRVPQENKDAFMLALGMVSTGVASVWGYYFGSSSGSKAKDDVIAKAVPRAA